MKFRSRIPSFSACLAILCALAPLLAPVSAFAAGSTSNADTSPPPRPPPSHPPPPKDGDPVGLIDGTVYDSALDLSVRCPGIDLVFRRSYSSLSTRTGPLGYGWTHSYDWQIEPCDDGVYVHSAGEGDVTDVCHKFTPVPDGVSAVASDGSVLTRGEDGGYVFVTPERTRYAFDAGLRLAAVTTWDGRGVSLVRDPSTGLLLHAMHSNGAKIAFVYSSDGSLAQVTSPDPGVQIEFGYSELAGRRVLSSVVRRDGTSASTNLYFYASVPRPKTRDVSAPLLRASSAPHQHASSGSSVLVPQPTMFLPSHVLLSRKTDADGVSTRYEYVRPSESPFAKCARSEMDGGVFPLALSFGSGSTVVRRPTASGESVTRIGYDARQRETSSETGSETRTRTYDASGDLVAERMSDSRTGAFFETRTAYDGNHRPVAVGTAFSSRPVRFTQLAWDGRRGRPNHVVTPEGRVFEWTTNGHDVVIHGAGADDARRVTRVLCSDADVPLAVIRPDGGRTDFAYHGSGRLSSVSAAGLPTTSFAYDSLGNVASVSLPGPDDQMRTVSFVNNWRGKPLSIAHPDGTTESFAYNGGGTRVVRRVDALGREDVYRWVLGLPVHAGRVIGGVTNALFTVSHDPQLNVIAITDPLGRPAESYVLDGNERVVAVMNLEGQVMTRTYALGKMVESETRFDGSAVAYGYGSDAKLASVAYPDETLHFAYDGDGLMTSAANASGTVSNRHDAATGWLDLSVGADGSAVSYLHSDGGSVTGVVSVAGTTRHVLDAAGRRIRTDSSAGTVRFGHCLWNGLLSAVTNANGVTAAYEYDIMNRVTNIAWRTASGSRLGGFAYQYDALGRIVSRNHDLGTNRFDRAYAYDDLDRLAADGDTFYTYDAAGNRMTRAKDGETVAYALGAGDRLASWTGGAYVHDAAGCVTRIVRGADMWDLTWNGQYQLVSVATNGVFAESYAYDALGRRVTTTNAEGTERHVYDDSWQVIADADEDGNVIRSYVWGEGIDRLLAVKIGSHVYTALTDIQGTVWGYADESGDVVAKWTYDAWGNVLSEEVDDSAAELRAVRYRFQGREWSAATGLTNFRMRWYDAVTGRWLSKDPIGLSGGLNLYMAGNGDFVNSNDELGTSPFIITGPNVFIPGNGPHWHHDGRKSRNNPLPAKPPIGDPSWKRLPAWQSKYHDNGIGKTELKYINFDGREAVYDGDTCELISDSENGGTYNYINPATDGDGAWPWIWRSAGHFGADIVPYWLWGN